MKLIVSNLEALRRYVTREFYYVTTDLISNYGWRHIETYTLENDTGTVTERLIKRFGEVPETILFWESYEFLEAHRQEIYRLKSLKIFFTDDLHWWNAWLRRIKLISFALCDIILSTYAYVWNKFYREFCGTKKVVWVPHSASPDFMLPFNPHPENSVFLSGAVTRHYPLRQQLLNLYLQRSYSITYHPHPGYYCDYDYRTNQDVGLGYARKLNRYRVGFTDSLIYEYVVAKHFEIPATGALLLAENAVSGWLEKLGFKVNEHYLPVSKENLEEIVQYVLNEQNHDELDKIRRRAQDLVQERHKTSDRARQINEACVS
ncbi:MAG TPA: glycosyltransferase [Candidatus Saccharimonadales bacterium]|nr:glycosyltransferase [Candidatus Saccharimonadales bacterium]